MIPEVAGALWVVWGMMDCFRALVVYGEDPPGISLFLSRECAEECRYAWRYGDRCGGLWGVLF